MFSVPLDMLDRRLYKFKNEINLNMQYNRMPDESKIMLCDCE